MTHVSEDHLLLLAYGELEPSEAARVEGHLAQCASCRAQFARLDAAHVALDVAMPRRDRLRWWLAAGVAAAAVLAAVLLTMSRTDTAMPGWRPTSEWSATAGYVTGGRVMMEIDAQLTRLEQERYYALPN